MFGAELRRRRIGAGLSLAALADLVHYSKSHLSKIETGAKSPGGDLARRCDAALEADGALVRLVLTAARGTPPPVEEDRDEAWVLNLHADGSSGFATTRRAVMVGGIAGLAARVVVPRRRSGGWAGGVDLAPFRGLLSHARALGQQVPAAMVIPMLVAPTHTLRTMASQVPAGQRPDVLHLAARFAEYTGWMAQETGDDDRAVWWTDRAVEMAAAAGDSGMAAYAQVRRALIAMYRQDPVGTVGLARLAQTMTGDPRVRGLAAQREAQGHALAGDRDACFRALDRAAGDLLRAADDGHLALGSRHLGDPVAMATGWCLFDLGRPVESAGWLRRELRKVPTSAGRVHARFGARLALALAGAGEPDEACAVIMPLLVAGAHLDSATIRTDLRALGRALNRWHARPGAQRVRAGLNAALHSSAWVD